MYKNKNIRQGLSSKVNVRQDLSSKVNVRQDLFSRKMYPFPVER